jgi:wyosine [tRNA(Phe)-imidazoG37] synthetase (radical SAM superfamily)
VAVITNGSLLYLPEVRADLLAADAVMPTLVAGTASLYRAIARPWPELTLDRLVDGMIAFRGVYSGKLWVEVMLINGLNDSETALQDLAAVLRRVAPDAIHLTLPDRPPAEPWVAPPDEARVLRAAAILGELAQVVHPAQGSVDLSGSDNLLDAVVAVITRHPVRETELAQVLQRWTPGQVAQALADLAASGRAQAVTYAGQRFWSSARARYALASASRQG